MQDKNVTDVEFREVPVEKKEETPALFNPVAFLTEALQKAGYAKPYAWTEGIDERAQTADNEKDRIFFANRALRLFLAEVENRDNITPRMLLADGVDSTKWMALMEQGVIPWLMNEFDAKGKRVKEEVNPDAADIAAADAARAEGFVSEEKAAEVTEQLKQIAAEDAADARPSSSEG